MSSSSRALYDRRLFSYAIRLARMNQRRIVQQPIVDAADRHGQESLQFREGVLMASSIGSLAAVISGRRFSSRSTIVLQPTDALASRWSSNARYASCGSTEMISSRSTSSARFDPLEIALAQ